MKCSHLLTLLATVFAIVGCGSPYKRVDPEPVLVAHDTMRVRPSVPWSRAPRKPFDIAGAERWIQFAGRIDLAPPELTFIGAVAPGKAIIKQRPKDNSQVPAYRADVTPEDLVSMIDVYYRTRVDAMTFETTNAQPETFMGKMGLQLDYNYVRPDARKWRGRAMIAIVRGKLYVLSLDAEAAGFDSSLPEFDAIVQSASVPVPSE